ncbi:uncharacterized protein PgNI_05118 [Pyricularia grisea]|uniref:Glycosyl hydrolase family 32 C-terminal domain-containing protein n=1 Tax=Pyricularia grisea TaxID=148305 RepID=A0A6P8BEY0_PYRGI|nr:uncharacterized protein PgNI_05118 [Pyricularia grisea]TLD14345.1 hypothetical protein PgNI_05118 [Pyricularia grisea]
MEVQSIFSSTDHGETWKDLGHIIEGPPQGWSVTGFRDPYVFPSPELDAIRGVGPHYYLTLGSGLKGQTRATSPNNKRPGFLGARMPLYAAPASDLKRWSFIGPVWESAPNASLGHPDVTGSYGYNFETSGIFTLPINRNGGSSRANSAWFALMGTEGGNTALHQHEHWAVWSRGTMSATGGRGGGAKFTPTSSGAADWGISYAHTSFVDGRRGNGNRRVMWGWANEDIDDRKNHPIGSWQYHVLKAFGYGGCMNLPLELFVKSTPGLRRSSTYSDGNEWIPDSKSAYTAQTMGIRPLPDVMRLLTNGAIQKTFNVGVLQAYSAPIKVIQNAGDSWVMKVTLKPIQGTAGIIIAQSPDNAEYTRIIYDAHAKQIVVQREHSTLLKGVFNTHTLTGHFEPYTSATGVTEDINFTIVFDKSLVEIFVNDRFALTTRVYTVRPDSTGISFFAGRANPATWTQATIWKGLNKAWPKRPEDSSSRLVWDSPKVTNGYTYWEGW